MIEQDRYPGAIDPFGRVEVMLRRRPIRQRLKAFVEEKGRRLPGGVRSFVLDRDAVERSVAEQALSQYPDQTLDSVALHAYQSAYGSCPDFPDFYDEDQIGCIYSWVRIRNWVDYFRNRTGSGPQIAGAPASYPFPAPLQTLGVPFAQGVADPTWPVVSSDPRGCDVNYLDAYGASHGLLFQRFGAPRGSSEWIAKPSRYHIGHDCIANPGDIVVAPESAEIGRIRSFYAGTEAMYLWTDTGLTINLGEIAPGSNDEFGVGVGSHVVQGQSVARIGSFEIGTQLEFHMLHFEIFQGTQTRSINWYDGEAMPQRLRNPTDYLLRASCALQPLGLAAQSPAELQALGRAVMADQAPGFPH